MISILDYDMANLRSVQKALEAVGHSARIIRTADEVASSDKLILPGVGAFADAVRLLREKGVDGAIRDHVKKGKYLFGICLGQQIIFEKGYEDGEHEGLGILKGDCVRFTVDADKGLKVPHMGWNTLTPRTPSPLFKGLSADTHVYFVHSYHTRPTDPKVAAATTDYGIDFVSSVIQDNVMAVQFHPEKSQAAGLTILKNFAEL